MQKNTVHLIREARAKQCERKNLKGLDDESTLDCKQWEVDLSPDLQRESPCLLTTQLTLRINNDPHLRV